MLSRWQSASPSGGCPGPGNPACQLLRKTRILGVGLKGLGFKELRQSSGLASEFEDETFRAKRHLLNLKPAEEAYEHVVLKFLAMITKEPETLF